jgi:hypothetical protein
VSDYYVTTSQLHNFQLSMTTTMDSTILKQLNVVSSALVKNHNLPTIESSINTLDPITITHWFCYFGGVTPHD